ncbi:putative ABC transport system permease protein [Methanolinea mesophila]|uniref:ABC transporter permease n=1 Tax=Methanolinea mesophila TaxID=547055 RepID=UPI001AEB236D|nr:ABC transporter permease [Methanolinea mesophila]MBP1929217.1 putative ABC transport system permease protein [Methanolinea mesophila]
MAKDVIFQLSLRSIRLHFLRSVLAALGIVIGVVAISSMGMMGANMTLSVTEELSSMGNVLVVHADSGGGGGMIFRSGGGGGGVSGGDDDTTISDSEFEQINRAADKYGTVYYLYSGNDRISISSQDGRASIYGLDPDVMPEILPLAEGAYPKSTSSVVIGPTLAERYGLTLGSRLTIGDEDSGEETVRVVGILEERGMSMDLNSDNAIITTEKWYTGVYGGEGEYDQVNVLLDDINDADAAKTAITDQLNRRENVVSVQDSSRMLESITSTLGTLTSFVMAIAGISLIVAAVSIFNVMMMSVTERVREIGILRSIGTQKGEIRRMFIYESVILGLVGAGIGAIVSLGMGYLIVMAMVGTTEYFFFPQSLVYIPLAMGVGIFTCVISGVYPAWRASNLDPIEALRAE